MITTSTTQKRHPYEYHVESVQPTDAPTGVSAGSWHRYIIVCGTSKVTGTKLGSLREVTRHAEAEAVRWNERFAKGGTVYATRGKKK